MAFADIGNVAQQNGHAVALGHHYVAHVVERVEQADAANVDALAADRKIVAARVGVAAGDGVHHLRHGDAVRQQLVGVDLGLILARGASKRSHIDDPRHLLDLANHQPVLRGLEFVQRISRTCELITINFAHRRFRRELRLKTIRQRHLLQAIQRFLAIGEVIAPKIEIHLDVAESKDADRADLIQFRRAVQSRLQRDRHLLLHLLRRPRGILRDKLDHRRRRIRVGLDVELQEGIGADRQHRQKHNENDVAIAKENANQRLHDYCPSPARKSSAPALTTLSPSLRPCVISSLSA